MPIVGVLVGLFLLFIFGKLLVLPVKVIGRLLVNGIAGAVVLYLINLVGGIFGLQVEITVLNALIAGFFGIPGVLVLLFVAAG